MSNNSGTSEQLPSAFTKFLAGLLLFAATSSIGTGIIIWRDSALTKQHINNIDTKYIDKSAHVIERLDALAVSLGKHFSDDNAHQLMIQREHLIFENFMDKLNDAHVDIETNKHSINLMQQGCCRRLNGE